MKKRMLIIISLLQWFIAGSLWASSSPEVDIHGFISQGYLKSNGDIPYLVSTRDGAYDFNEMGINFNSQVSDGLKLGVQFFARDLGNIGNDEIKVHWAYGDYFYRKWFGLRAGKIPLAHGFYNETRDVDMLRCFVLLPQALYVEHFRDFYMSVKGFGCYGILPAGLSYQFNAGTSTISSDSSFMVLARDMFQTNIDSSQFKYLYNGSLIWSPADNLRIGTTMNRNDINGTGTDLIQGPAATTDDIHLKFNVMTFSAEYIYKNLTCASEYALYDIHFNLSDPTSGQIVKEHTVNGEGYYGSLSYRFTDWFELGGYYSVLYYDRNTKESSPYVKQTTLSTRFDLNEYCLLKLEGHSVQYLTNDKWLFATKVSFRY